MIDQHLVLARYLAGAPTETDRGIGAPPAVPGHEADRLASLARSEARGAAAEPAEARRDAEPPARGRRLRLRRTAPAT
ncbi:hypothetical protein [Streptomyces aidingensis]|uniref:Uncharacterized protein n=1 Tax=Streptomyces aidingensis TaxID=910347 RepID=A0A1I1PCF5_9ACTN|nr:hypothetical protein [Streptomyces aidingensis]SFD07584.1 hypothetical protein SAMN05421773_109108 [Streptomyces aidingensis]